MRLTDYLSRLSDFYYTLGVSHHYLLELTNDTLFPKAPINWPHVDSNVTSAPAASSGSAKVLEEPKMINAMDSKNTPLRPRAAAYIRRYGSGNGATGVTLQGRVPRVTEHCHIIFRSMPSRTSLDVPRSTRKMKTSVIDGTQVEQKGEDMQTKDDDEEEWSFVEHA